MIAVIVVYWRVWGDGKPYIQVFDYAEDSNCPLLEYALEMGDCIQFF